MIDLSYLIPGGIIRRAINSWPNPPNLQEVRAAMCELLDDAPLDWVRDRPKLKESPHQIIHAASGPPQKLSVQWRGDTLCFDSDDANALVKTMPNSGNAWH